MFEKLKNPIHPQVKDVFEVKGDDVGRVKDVEFAHDVAQKLNESRNFNESGNEHFGIPLTAPEERINSDSRFLRGAIADRAIRNIYGEDLRMHALREHYDLKAEGHDDVPVMKELVLSSYDELERRAAKKQEKRNS